MKIIAPLLTFFLALMSAHGHCQVPCGIYDDPAKFQELAQHTETIHKAMVAMLEINLEDSDDVEDEQQFVRWTMVKEAHAQKIQQEMLDYFLAQRIRLGTNRYDDKLRLIHMIITDAMQCKQTVNTDNATLLAQHIEEFKDLYFGNASADDHHHGEDDHGHSH